MTEDDLTRPNLCASTYSLSVCGMVGTFQSNFEKRVQSIYTNPFWIQCLYISEVNAIAIGLTFTYALCSLWRYLTHRLHSTHNIHHVHQPEYRVQCTPICNQVTSWWLGWLASPPLGESWPDREWARANDCTQLYSIVLNCTQLYSMQAKDCTRSSLHIAYCTQTVQAPGCSPCSLTTRATNWCWLTV